MGMVIKELQDLTYLKWSHIRSSSGTAGTFYKSQSTIDGVKKYYKLSNFEAIGGVVGHECVNEIIVDRLLTIFGIAHLEYELINADIEIEGRIYNTYLCASRDFKARGENKIALEDYYRISAVRGESRYDFCIRQGWKQYVEAMLFIDFLILNRDRHGANIEVLRNKNRREIRLAPLFDHGLSFMFACRSDEQALSYDILEDKRCQNFIGGYSCYDNLKLICDKKAFAGILRPEHKQVIFEDLDGILSEVFIDKIWDMIWERYRMYENL